MFKFMRVRTRVRARVYVYTHARGTYIYNLGIASKLGRAREPDTYVARAL